MQRFRASFAVTLALSVGLIALSLISAGIGSALGDDDAGASAKGDGPGNPADVGRTIQIEARDIGFDVKTIRVKPGETIRFVVTNKGAVPHEFVLANHKENVEHCAMMAQMPDMVHHDPNMITLQPGETKELIWRFGDDPNFEFSCNIPGHSEAGMWGTFTYMK